MLASLVLCATPVMLLLSVAQRPPPPSGKYFKIVFEPTDCIEVDFLPCEAAADVSLFFVCVDHDETSDDLSVDETQPFYYQVAADSIPAYENFISRVDAECPYDVQNGDLKTFDYDYGANTVTVKLEGNPVTLNKGSCHGG
ncbi:hypothetical protein FOZ62_026528 [Perkinsus olseni]|uniref:Uncharacterized protein n=1 Tax=Perkinsus olseni TaxID=32597 RepID=A0A7J6U5X4_PEROL|nr:hypothetical protein FOZ62_026528 [Perkinsus olseni]